MTTTRVPITPTAMEELRTKARYHRERLALYRARAYGPRATSEWRLRELERASVRADLRLHRAGH